MRIVIVSLYNPFAYGPRSVLACLERDGHQVQLLHFQLFRIKKVPWERTDAEDRKLAEEGMGLPVKLFRHDGYDYLPYVSVPAGEEVENFLAEIERFQPDMVGFSVNSAVTGPAEVLGRRIRERFPDVTIMWGGVYPAINPERSIQAADVICLGEGEEAVCELASRPERKDVPGLWFREGDGHIHRNPCRPLIQNLDSLPPAMYKRNEVVVAPGVPRDIFVENDESLRPVFVFMTSRGCPGNCSFCFHSVFRENYNGQRYIRRRSVENCIAELVLRKERLKLKEIYIWDDVFAMQEEWVGEFCRRYKEEIGLPWYAYVHPATTTRSMLECMRDAGAISVGLGIQCASERISRDIYDRRFPVTKLRDLAVNIGEVGFPRCCYEMLSNSPWEEEEDCRRNVDLLTGIPQPTHLEVIAIRLFPEFKIARGAPRESRMSEEDFIFWNMTYLLTALSIPRRVLDGFIRTGYFRRHPLDYCRFGHQLVRRRKRLEGLSPISARLVFGVLLPVVKVAWILWAGLRRKVRRSQRAKSGLVEEYTYWPSVPVEPGK